MRMLRRAGIGAVCAAGAVLIIGYYGTPIVRTALAGLVGLLIVAGMMAALRATRRGELIRDHRRTGSPSERGTAPVYYLPHAFTGGHAVGDQDAAVTDRTHRAIRLDRTTRVGAPLAEEQHRHDGQI